MDSFTDIPFERFEHTYRVNIFAYFQLAQLAVKHFLVNKIKGNIINVGSIQAYMPTPNILDYASTKVGTRSRLITTFEWTEVKYLA